MEHHIRKIHVNSRCITPKCNKERSCKTSFCVKCLASRLNISKSETDRLIKAFIGKGQNGRIVPR